MRIYCLCYLSILSTINKFKCFKCLFTYNKINNKNPMINETELVFWNILLCHPEHFSSNSIINYLCVKKRDFFSSVPLLLKQELFHPTSVLQERLLFVNSLHVTINYANPG